MKTTDWLIIFVISLAAGIAAYFIAAKLNTPKPGTTLETAPGANLINLLFRK